MFRIPQHGWYKFTKKHQHITPILVSLHSFPVHYRCQYKVLMYVFKSLHGSAPVYLQELVSIYQPTRSLRSENCALIKSPRIRTKTYGERRFDKAAATLWNILHGQLRNEQSLSCFKKMSKHIFLDLHIQILSCLNHYLFFTDYCAFLVFLFLFLLELNCYPVLVNAKPFC